MIEIEMNSFKPADVGVIYGGQLVGRSLSGILNYIDTIAPGVLFGQPISFWGELIGAIGGILGGVFLDYPYNFVATVVGASLAGDLMDKAISPTIIRIATPPTPPSAVAKGRYAVTT